MALPVLPLGFDMIRWLTSFESRLRSGPRFVYCANFQDLYTRTVSKYSNENILPPHFWTERRYLLQMGMDRYTLSMEAMQDPGRS